jgi:hypothetical protein
MKINTTFIIIISLLIAACAGSKKQQEQKKHDINTKNTDSITFIQDSIAFELCKIYGLDQGLRSDVNYYLRTVPNNVALHFDSICFDKFVKFVEKHGMPTVELVGEKNAKHECVASISAVILLHHIYELLDKNDRRYFNLFLKETNEGRLSKRFFATVLDKYYWIKYKYNGRTMYGSDFGKPCIEDKAISDSLRAEIGLPPLADSLFLKDCPQ